MTLFKQTNEDSHTFHKIVIACIIICIIVGFACFRFYQQVRQTVGEESEHYLSEISSRIASNIEKTINDNFSILRTMKSELENANLQSYEQVGAFLHRQETAWDFNKVLLIDDTGVAYNYKGLKVSITGDSFLRTLSTEKSTIAPSQMINNEETVVFASPLQNVTIGKDKIVALATCYHPDEFDDILSMTSFNEKAYSYIVDEDGKTIIRPSSKNAPSFGYNVLHTLLKEDPSAKETTTQMLKDMKQQKRGLSEVSLTKEKDYIIYTPVTDKGWYLYTFVPVSIVSEKSNLLLQSTLLMSGLIFTVFLVFLLIIIVSFTRHRKRLEQIAYVDELTNGNTIQRFQELVKERLTDTNQAYALIFTNIQKFKVLNDQFGRVTCDTILTQIYQGISNVLHEDEVLGRISADNFAILVKYDSEQKLIKKLFDWDVAIETCAHDQQLSIPLFTMEYGIYVIENPMISLQDMMDCAKLALRDNVLTHGENDYVHYAFYDDENRKTMLLEKHLEDMMDHSLKEGEFKVYLQPKYDLTKNTIAGAEALVRWDSKSDGMIYPNDFIPLFEKNGFIVKLDLWMFEQSCMLIQKWIEEGKEPIKISVNCSRVHLKNPEFLKEYQTVFEKYTIPAKYLELEFTENMVFEDSLRLARVIDAIHELGFGCSMDDFGSGYSSLNLLQDIHVDTIKLDRIFFKSDFNDHPRNMAIIECILEMANALKMTTVAEGIEEWGQVNELREMGCDLVQGYVFAKPMTVDAFEDLLFHPKRKEANEQ